MKGIESILLSKGGCVQGKGLLVVNPTSKFLEVYASKTKSAKNRALYALRGVNGTIRPNKAGTCLVLEIGVGAPLMVGEAGELASTNDQLNELARAGRAWWCKDTNGGGCPSIWITSDAGVAARVAAKGAADAARPRFTTGALDMGRNTYGPREWIGSPTVSELRRCKERGVEIILLGEHPEGLLASLEAQIAAEDAAKAGAAAERRQL